MASVFRGQAQDSSPEALRAVQKSLTTALKTIAGKGTITEGPMQGRARTWRIA